MSFWQLKWVVKDTRNSESIHWLHIKRDLKFDLVTINSVLRDFGFYSFTEFSWLLYQSVKKFTWNL